ncbi:MAG: TIGR02679 family protein [Gaiellaceae bacterium]
MRTRYERLGRIGGSVRLAELSEEEASALSGLLAPLRRRERPRACRPFRLPLRDLDQALQATRFALTLPDALELVGPPVDLRPQRRARERIAAVAAWEDALSHPLCRRDEPTREWVGSLRERGLLRRTAGHDAMRVLTLALDAGDRLPHDPPLERTRLATQLTGDPHELDDDRPLARLLLGQLAARAGLSRPSAAIERRALWQRFAVTTDPASADVLTLGLRPLRSGRLSRALLLLHGRHFRLTVGQLAGEPLRFTPGDVFLCENPTVLTAAEERLGDGCPPLVCTGGWPNTATWTLLEALRMSGARLHHHGDFDWDGVRIATLLRERFDVRPWRFDATSYLAGVERHPERTRTLDGRPAREDADAGLVAAMHETGLELHEEAVLEPLLDDLAQERPRMS